eukprot:Awhi_evm1s13060
MGTFLNVGNTINFELAFADSIMLVREQNSSAKQTTTMALITFFSDNSKWNRKDNKSRVLIPNV